MSAWKCYGPSGFVIVVWWGGGTTKFASFPSLSVINFSFHSIPLKMARVRTFPAPLWRLIRFPRYFFHSARYLFFRLYSYYERRQEFRVPPQLDFSATIKAKRRAVDGENDAESTDASTFLGAAVCVIYIISESLPLGYQWLSRTMALSSNLLKMMKDHINKYARIV